MKDNLLRGGYLISFENNPGPAHVVQRLFPAESLKRWDIPQTDGQPYLSLYRLKWDVLAAHRNHNGGSAAPSPARPARASRRPWRRRSDHPVKR